MPANITPEKRKRTRDASVEFLLEEYRNIAATHDRMRDVINRMFYYFLLLSAVPEMRKVGGRYFIHQFGSRAKAIWVFIDLFTGKDRACNANQETRGRFS